MMLNKTAQRVTYRSELFFKEKSTAFCNNVGFNIPVPPKRLGLSSSAPPSLVSLFLLAEVSPPGCGAASLPPSYDLQWMSGPALLPGVIKHLKQQLSLPKFPKCFSKLKDKTCMKNCVQDVQESITVRAIPQVYKMKYRFICFPHTCSHKYF